ncbi:hypothetical protein H9K75_01290 [Diaphorobacter aerolatus]|uniref:Uncharacterized protein n=1 Tax=Diaphorobacter aerolatus TaxID=1288495 RepID=A0A7H0GPY9_9BURK|nr:hypothetical protein H9K75_01290 [Diaphorobacter aerolatus]
MAVQRELAIDSASDEQAVVLKRIYAQRDRIEARRVALSQARALRARSADHVDSDAPLLMRLIAFAKLHPVAVAAVAGAALFAGPARLMRIGGIVLPIVMKMRSGR